MDPKTRRGVLGMTGVALLAGCSGSGDEAGDDAQNQAGGTQDSDDDGIPDSEDDFPNDPDYSVESELINDERQIPEDEWYRWKFDFDAATELSYEFTVRDGPAIDVLMFTAEEYEHYEDQERARYLTATSVLDSPGGSATGAVNSGTHYFVLDNTNWGEAKPPTNMDDDLAKVEIELVGRR